MVKKGKNKKSLKKNIIIIFISIVILILCVFFAIGDWNKDNVEYTSYNDEMISINEVDNMKVKANILDDYLVVLLESTSKNAIDTEVQVQYSDMDGNAVFMDRTSATILTNGKNLLFFEVPELKKQYAGDITIDIETKETSFGLKVDLSKIIYQETHEVLDTGEINFHITGQNQNNSSILGLVSYIVALKDDNIVAYNTFSQEKVEANGTFTLDTSFHGMVNQDDEVVPVDYDELLIFTSFVNDDYEI